MELINATRMLAGYTMGVEPSGRESLVVVIKGTFVLPRPGETVRLHDEQVPLLMADTFIGAPGFSAPLHEADFAPRKNRCDVLLAGSAYAPGGRPVTRTHVGLHVGPMRKSFDVVGDRVWEASLGAVSASLPMPFETMNLSYGCAFGGVDVASEDPAEHSAYAVNPVGLGFRKLLKASWIDGIPLPNTEETGVLVDAPDGSFQPMAYGPVGRGWPQRACHAGTYDQAWLDNGFPFPPMDFDDRYYQAAPLDQQIPIPNAALEVRLENLTPDGLRHFVLPFFEAPIHVFPKNNASREDLVARLDTIVFEPDLERFTMQWRVARPLRDNMFEVSQVLVGRKGEDWWQARDEMTFPIRFVNAPVDADADLESYE
ncbi:DUF2169 domain-containing protein [Variovorax atrisoli]|uniref:DUF2169 family type VI secretion system accessory protein n=1 Tax=Variovorax atrisoli TaxID=3394203 RepID=UPI000F7D8CD8|nr:DUF2169 domain-containing protein [Variovorax sp. 369]RTD90966.1 DUF2169 domain-containing protein [Variovorax sp. 369]